MIPAIIFPVFVPWECRVGIILSVTILSSILPIYDTVNVQNVIFKFIFLTLSSLVKESDIVNNVLQLE